MSSLTDLYGLTPIVNIKMERLQEDVLLEEMELQCINLVSVFRSILLQLCANDCFFCTGAAAVC
jgi:hypothetical protein